MKNKCFFPLFLLTLFTVLFLTSCGPIVQRIYEGPELKLSEKCYIVPVFQKETPQPERNNLQKAIAFVMIPNSYDHLFITQIDDRKITRYSNYPPNYEISEGKHKLNFGLNREGSEPLSNRKTYDVNVFEGAADFECVAGKIYKADFEIENRKLNIVFSDVTENPKYKELRK